MLSVGRCHTGRLIAHEVVSLKNELTEHLLAGKRPPNTSCVLKRAPIVQQQLSNLARPLRR